MTPRKSTGHIAFMSNQEYSVTYEYVEMPDGSIWESKVSEDDTFDPEGYRHGLTCSICENREVLLRALRNLSKYRIC